MATLLCRCLHNGGETGTVITVIGLMKCTCEALALLPELWLLNRTSFNMTSHCGAVDAMTTAYSVKNIDHMVPDRFHQFEQSSTI